MALLFLFPKKGSEYIMEKLKRVVIKEELVALTGDFKKAIVLNQMIYWSERVKDVDKYIEDEKRRSTMAMGASEKELAEQIQEIDLLTHGWIYKSAEELSEETMMGVSKSTMGRYLAELVDKGWLAKRKNPKWKGDNTFQYRVNLFKIIEDLHQLGYYLDGYPMLISVIQNEIPKFHYETPKSQNEMDCSKIERIVPKQNNITRDYSEITSEILEEEEEIITLDAVTEFLNQQIIKRQITNPKTLTAIFEVAGKCKAIGTIDIEAMQNYCIKVIEEKMKIFGQKQATRSKTNYKSSKIEIIPAHLTEQQPTESTPAASDKLQDIENMLKKLKEENKMK